MINLLKASCNELAAGIFSFHDPMTTRQPIAAKPRDLEPGNAAVAIQTEPGHHHSGLPDSQLNSRSLHDGLTTPDSYRIIDESQYIETCY